MIELLQSFLEWRSAIPEVYGAIAPALGAALIGVGGGFLNSLLNRPSGAERQALQIGNEASQAQADEIRRHVPGAGCPTVLVGGDG